MIDFTSRRSLDLDYVLGDILGSGGMGIVYCATQLSLGRRVAVKIPHAELANDPLVIRRFRTEALAGGRLSHRNLARVIDFGGLDGAPFLVMEYVAGTSLEKLITEQGPMETHGAADVCAQILAALDVAHAAGIIHADIKSANVLVETLPGGALHARVIDFGLARFRDDPNNHEDDLLLSGTPDYLAPELVHGGAPTVASDIYAAGVVLYELLTGMTPFSGGSAADVLRRQIADALVPPSLRCPEQAIPDPIEAVVMRALAKDPAARFETAAAFNDALRAAMSVVLISKLPLARGTRTSLFSVEATTRNWSRPIVPGAELATGETVRIQQIRKSVGEAIALRDSDMIVTSYLELVRALIDGGQLAVAAVELGYGVALLRPNAQAKPTSLWRLQLCLAAVYSGLGDSIRAGCAARVGHDDAIQAESLLGQERASQLIARLARHANALRRTQSSAGSSRGAAATSSPVES